MLSRTSRIAAAIAVGVLVIPQAACGTIGGLLPGQEEESEVTWPGEVQIPHAIPKDLARIAPTKNCPSGTLIPATAREPRDGLSITTTRFMAGGLQYNVMLSQETLQRIPQALSTTQYLNMDFAYSNGAYAAGGAVADVDFFNMSEQDATVHDIRPVNIVRECMPLAALILYLSEGGDPIRLQFDMDADAPVAHDTGTGGLYFKDSGPFTVAPLTKQTLQMNFDTMLGAYSFEVAVDYDIDGKRYTSIFDHSGTRFRIAALPCITGDDLRGLPDEAVRHLKSLRFDNVRRRGLNTIETVDPADEAADCPW